MLKNRFFDAHRVNVEAAADDDVFQAIYHIEQAVFGYVAEIARADEAVDESLRRLVGSPPIALHDLWTAHADFADLARGQHLSRIDGTADLQFRARHDTATARSRNA